MEILKTDCFEPIALEDMEQVKLMNRTDTKYWFHLKQLSLLFSKVKDDYFILNMFGESMLPYSTVYYDTPESLMFLAHHNGKLNRYKIRRRSYVASNISFLEVKFKSNKGRTIKKRISSDFKVDSFTDKESKFISDLTPFDSSCLRASLINDFKRITLVNKNFKERCTIDSSLKFTKGDKTLLLDNLVVLEIKSEGSVSGSPLARALREQRIKSSGFSKYCVGRSLTDARLKRNLFKRKVRSIEKIIETNNHLYN